MLLLLISENLATYHFLLIIMDKTNKEAIVVRRFNFIKYLSFFMELTLEL